MRTLFLLCSMFMVIGCKSVPLVPVQIAPDQYQIPIETGKVETPAGWENEVVGMAEIVVPPSDVPTVIHIREKSRTIKQKLFPSKKQQTFDVVSSNKGTTTKQAAVTPWWYWALGLLGAGGTVWALINRYLGPVKAIAGGAWALISRVWRK